MSLPPPPTSDPSGSFAWLEWFRQLRDYISTTGSVPWGIINFAGSTLSSIASRSHQVLQALQGGTTGEYYHLTSAQHTDLTDGGTTTLHSHAGGAGDLKADGTVPLTADWDAGSFEIRSQTFESDVATGTAPLVIASTTKVSNLNSDLLDGADWTAPGTIGSVTPNTIVGSTVKASTAAGFISSDGSTGYTGTVTTGSLVGKTITIKDGIITGFA